MIEFIKQKQDKKEGLSIELKSNTLKNIGDHLVMKIYIGQTDSIIKEGIIENIYDKGKYNMLLCRFRGKGGDIYHSCAIQYKESLIIL